MKLFFALISLAFILLLVDPLTARKKGKLPKKTLKVSSNENDSLHGGPLLTEEDMIEIKKNIKEKIVKKQSKSKLSTKQVVKAPKDMKKAYDTVKKILIRLMLISKVSFGGAPVGHTAGIFVALLDLVIGEHEQGVWESIVHRVDAKITDAITSYHFNRSKEAFHELNVIKQLKANNFDSSDMVALVASKYLFMPYNYDDLGYSVELAALLPSWMVYMSTLGLQIMSMPDINLEECLIGKQFVEFRGQVVKAAKSQLRKRYRRISGINYFDKPKGFAHCPGDGFGGGANCEFWSFLTYFDAYTKVNHDKKLVEVEGLFTETRKEMVASLMASMIEPINAFFHEDICGEGCECPTNITEEEITHDYPKECYGQTINDGKCTLPCGLYGYDYNWCPYLESQNANFFSDHLNNDHKKCTKPNWKECMHVPPDVVVTLVVPSKKTE